MPREPIHPVLASNSNDYPVSMFMKNVRHENHSNPAMNFLPRYALDVFSCRQNPWKVSKREKKQNYLWNDLGQHLQETIGFTLKYKEFLSHFPPILGTGTPTIASRWESKGAFLSQISCLAEDVGCLCKQLQCKSRNRPFLSWEVSSYFSWVESRFLLVI